MMEFGNGASGLPFGGPAVVLASGNRLRPPEMVRTVMLLGLVDVFEEDPVAEAAALGALAGRLGHDVVPAHVVGCGEGPEYFQDVG